MKLGQNSLKIIPMTGEYHPTSLPQMPALSTCLSKIEPKKPFLCPRQKVVLKNGHFMLKDFSQETKAVRRKIHQLVCPSMSLFFPTENCFSSAKLGVLGCLVSYRQATFSFTVHLPCLAQVTNEAKHRRKRSPELPNIKVARIYWNLKSEKMRRRW